MLLLLTHQIGLPYFRAFRKPVHFNYTLDELSCMPIYTLGYQLFQFLNSHNLSLLPYYEKHDIKHVVLNYPPTDKGEVCLQCFMLANGRYTLPVFVTVLFGWCVMPNYWKDFVEAYKRGRKCKSLQELNWFSLITSSLLDIQNQIFNPTKK